MTKLLSLIAAVGISLTAGCVVRERHGCHDGEDWDGRVCHPHHHTTVIEVDHRHDHDHDHHD